MMAQQQQQPPQKSTGNAITNSIRRLSRLKFSDYGKRSSTVSTMYYTDIHTNELNSSHKIGIKSFIYDRYVRNNHQN